MTASATVAAPAPQEVKQIPTEQLVPSPANPRKTIDPAFLAQLADSIQQLGVQVPLLVRLAQAENKICGPLYEIIAGHRRFEAAKLLKLETLPCIVRGISDDEAQEIMLVENLQREDLPPLEEAEAYEALRATLGAVPTVAAKVGKPIDYVTRRLKLLTLIEFSREALARRLITLDHALLLAKLAPAEQETALRYTLDRNVTRKDKTQDVLAKSIERRDGKRHYGYWEPQSVLELKAFIEREIKLELKRAPWDLADAALVASAGACVGCPKNTAANAALFGDLAVEDARCTDSACFAAKRAAFVQVQLDAMKAAGVDAVRVSWKETSSEPRMLAQTKPGDHEKYLAQVFKAGQWIEAKKGSCSFVRTGVTVDFDEQKYGSPDVKKRPGMKLLVCVVPGCKAHRKAWEQAEKRASGSGGSRLSEADQQRVREEAEKREKLIADTEYAIRGKVWSTIIGKLDASKALRMVADQYQAAAEIRKKLLAAYPKLNGLALEALTVFWLGFASTVRVNDYWMAQSLAGVHGDREQLWKLAKAAGVNADAMAAQHFHAAGSVPKGLEDLYPKGVPWPKAAPKKSSPEAPAKKAHTKKPTSSPARKKAAKKGGKR